MTEEKRGPLGVLRRRQLFKESSILSWVNNLGPLDFQRRRLRPPEEKPPEVKPKPAMPGRKERRKTETPLQTVQRFRRRFPGLVIPDPGPEPQPLEGELEPPRIEEQGVVWALETAWGMAGRFGATEEQQESIFRSILPKVLPKREYWERETARGMRELLGLK